MATARNAAEAHPSQISVADIFEAVYGDAAGHEYWCLWLKRASGAEVERLLVAHWIAETPDVAPRPAGAGNHAALKP
jgi:hypothetical protein